MAYKPLNEFAKERGIGAKSQALEYAKMSPSQRKKWHDTDRSVAGKKHVAYSPDGFAISAAAKRHKNYSSAHKELTNWAKQYERQGYYSTGNREHIPVNEIVKRSRIKAE